MKNIIPILILFAILASCASNKTDLKPTEDTTVVVVVPNTPVQRTDPESDANARIRSSISENVMMKARISIDFPQMKNSVSATIEMARMDSVLLTISGPFGISVGKLYANRDEFVMNNSLQSISFTGSPTDTTIMKAAQLPLSFDDIVTLLRTALPNKRANGSGMSDISDGKLLGYKRMDEEENIVMDATFGNHIVVFGLTFAKHIVLDFPLLGGKVTLDMSDIVVGGKLSSPMRIVPPKSYRVIKY
ncbi:MAG: DUF4292 domain-containing protein [Ignavibacteria bacterium]|jgi:hypothetical protein|nr:DUF4292 domain-containing protein [Ignavibacteria bacterium]